MRGESDGESFRALIASWKKSHKQNIKPKEPRSRSRLVGLVLCSEYGYICLALESARVQEIKTIIMMACFTANDVADSAVLLSDD